jgi:hypothetical protein
MKPIFTLMETLIAKTYISNPDWMSLSKMQGPGELMVWCRIWGNKIVRPICFDTNLNAEMYLNTLQDTIMPYLLKENGEFMVYFQQYRAPPHYGICMRQWLISSFQVAGLVTVVLWNSQGPQI